MKRMKLFIKILQEAIWLICMSSIFSKALTSDNLLKSSVSWVVFAARSWSEMVVTKPLISSPAFRPTTSVRERPDSFKATKNVSILKNTSKSFHINIKCLYIYGIFNIQAPLVIWGLFVDQKTVKK